MSSSTPAIRFVLEHVRVQSLDVTSADLDRFRRSTGKILGEDVREL